ncbi:MAG: shikimate kinase [Peptococcaceae bacterium]|nr:shikimate kinase [Peptococcaceae bacterium]
MKDCCPIILKPKNIILIGFMAAGKSSIGQLLARELNWDFLDTDTEIVNQTGLSIPEIFRKYGEARFRQEESLLIQRLVNINHTVIATGGGLVLNPDNWVTLQRLGMLIHLYVPLELALQRVKKRSERPLLARPEEELSKLWLERLAIYNKASVTFDTSGKNPEAIVAEISAYLKGDHCHVTTNKCWRF